MKFQSVKPDYVVRVEGAKCAFKHGFFETNDKKLINGLKKNKNIKEIGKKETPTLPTE